MSQGTTPINYRDTVGTENDCFLRSKKANAHTGSTGLDPTSILFSPLPRLRMPVLQSPFKGLQHNNHKKTTATTTRTTTATTTWKAQQPEQPGQQPQQLPIKQQQPVHYSNYKSMGNVHLKPYQGKYQSPVKFWDLFIQYCTLLKHSEYETATSFPFFVTDYVQDWYYAHKPSKIESSLLWTLSKA